MSSIPAVDSAPATSPATSAAGFGLAGVLLVGLALPAAGRLGPTGLTRWLEGAAVVLALLTVLAALGAMLLRLRGPDSSPRPQVRLALTAGGLLLASVLLTGSAAIAVLADGPPARAVATEGLTVAVSGVGETAQLTMAAVLPDVAAGALVRAEVAAVLDDDGNRAVLAQQVTVADRAGSVSVQLAAQSVGGYDRLQVLVESPGRRCTANVRPQISETPTTSCKPR
jgi:hypothetical protein